MHSPSFPQRAHGRVWPVSAATVLALAAAWAGGGTGHGAESAILAGIGFLVAVSPPPGSPKRWLILSMAGLVILAGCGFLPAAWFSPAPWRAEVIAAGVPLPATLSAQPQVTLETLLLLAGGIVWLAWLDTQPWDAAARRASLRLMACGIAAIAAAALLARWAHWRIPGWLSEPPFGPFPNRNHTGHLLGLGGILALGSAAHSARSGWRRSLGWLAAAAIIFVALVVNYSRGGMILFFGGCALWIGLTAWNRRSWPLLACGASALLVGGAIFLIAGGPLAARFAGGENSEVAFRVKIWRDTLALIHTAPWCGAGLGNFAALFPFFRHASVIQEGVRHPESDWLWLASELGWPAVALVLGALVAMIRPAFPFPRGSQRNLRGAALSAGIAAALHGLIDVPGHRFGCVLPALLILATARNDWRALAPSRTSTLGWRIAGVALMCGAVWYWRLPDDTARAAELSQAGHFPEAIATANRALRRAPLDWRGWFIRAGAEASVGKPLEALADFRRARFLEPHFAGVPMEEGRFWVRIQPMLALQAWRDALRRLRPGRAEPLFAEMFQIAPDNTAFRSGLLELAAGRPELQVTWFRLAPLGEAMAHREEIAKAAERCDKKHQEDFERRVKELEGGK